MALLTGFLVNAFARAAAGLLILAVYLRQGKTAFSAVHAPTLAAIVVVGLLGIGIISGLAYALPKIGVAAGVSMIINGQMAMGVLVDTLGLAGGQPIPLSWVRVVALFYWS